MRSVALVIGVLLIVVGAVWTVQGYGTLKGSFMTGRASGSQNAAADRSVTTKRPPDR